MNKLNSSDNENIEKNPKTNQIDYNNQLNLNKFSPYKKNQIILNEDKEDNDKNITINHNIKSPNIRENLDNSNDNNKNNNNIDNNININNNDNNINININYDDINNKESSSSEYEEDSNSSEIIINNQNYNNQNNEDDDEDVSEEEKKDQFNNSESLSRFNESKNIEIISSDEENNDEKLNIFNEPYSPFNSDLNVKKKNNTDDDFHSRKNSFLEKLQKNEIKRKDSTLNVPSSSSIRNIFTSPEKLNVVEEEGKIPSFDIDDYDFIKPIGEGSFGKIYLIENFETHEQYALKKIICHSLDEVKQFQREFELMYSKAHDNIMKIYKVQYKCLDFTTYSIYVLMELAIYDWNTEITNRKINKQFYTEKEIVDILKQIVGALYFLEKNNIAHRDIKPQNVLIYKNNVYKVADFGEAKSVQDTIQEATLRGSELYMSPALFNGLKYNKKNVVHNAYKSDVFSLGYCVLFAMSLNINILNEIRQSVAQKPLELKISKELKKNYANSKLIPLIHKMLALNEAERIDFKRILIYLNENFS